MIVLRTIDIEFEGVVASTGTTGYLENIGTPVVILGWENLKKKKEKQGWPLKDYEIELLLGRIFSSDFTTVVIREGTFITFG